MTPELMKLRSNKTALTIETMSEQILQLKSAHNGQQLLQKAIVNESEMMTSIGTKVQIAITSG